MERSIQDTLWTIKRILEYNKLLLELDVFKSILFCIYTIMQGLYALPNNWL